MTGTEPLPTRQNLPEKFKDYTQWPQGDPLSLSEDKRIVFLRRRKAIVLYLEGASHQMIFEQTSLSRGEVLYFFRRCLEPHPQGNICGFCALIPYFRLKAYERTKEIKPAEDATKLGQAGALMKLFVDSPELKDLVDRLYLKKPLKHQKIHEPKISVKNIHKAFIDMCRDLQIPKSCYPFTSKDLGGRSLAAYLKRLSETQVNRTVAARNGRQARKKLGSGEDNLLSRPDAPGEMVELDGHKVDALWTINIPHPHLGFTTVVLPRIWILAIIDCFSRAILGYCLCLSREYNHFHVLKCIKNALVPWKELPLTIPGLKYQPGSGLPSGVLPDYAWAKWDLMILDNAHANLAEAVRDILKTSIDSDINAGPVWTLDRRPFVEGFFLILEDNLYHRLPNTTGSHPKDTRRNSPARAALKFDVNIGDLIQITDVYIAGYNNTPNEGLGYATPLEALSYYASKNALLIDTLSADEQNALWLLNDSRECTVCGNINVGRRPYINFFYARYDNHLLRNSPGLVGKKLRVTFDSNGDIRYLRAFHEGQDLGTLYAKGPWCYSAHDLLTRQIIARLKYRKILHYLDHEDAVRIFLKYLAEKAQKSKTHRSLLADTCLSLNALAVSDTGESIKDVHNELLISVGGSQSGQSKNQEPPGRVILLRR